MIEIKYIDAILNLRHNAAFSVEGDDYESIIWYDNVQTKPTKEEVDTELIRYKHEWKLNEIRSKRDLLLMESDKYSFTDFPHSSEEKKQEWLTYRQSLRDITNNLDTTTIELYLDEFQEIQFSNFTWLSKPSK